MIRLDLNSILNGAIGYPAYYAVAYLRGHPATLGAALNIFVTGG